VPWGQFADRKKRHRQSSSPGKGRKIKRKRGESLDDFKNVLTLSKRLLLGGLKFQQDYPSALVTGTGGKKEEEREKNLVSEDPKPVSWPDHIKKARGPAGKNGEMALSNDKEWGIRRSSAKGTGRRSYKFPKRGRGMEPRSRMKQGEGVGGSWKTSALALKKKKASKVVESGSIRGRMGGIESIDHGEKRGLRKREEERKKFTKPGRTDSITGAPGKKRSVLA